MSLDGEPSGTSNMTGFQKFYDSPTCSDVKIVVLNMLGMETVIHAHRIILAAGSGYFNREHELAKKAEAKVEAWYVYEDDAEVMTAAIRYLYGFDFSHDIRGIPKIEIESVFEISRIGVVAKKFEIAGLLEWASKTAQHNLAGCLNDEAKLETFLDVNTARFRLSIYMDSITNYDFVVNIIRENIKELHGKAAFQKLLKDEPKVALKLLDSVVEELKSSDNGQ